jgi:hypothetical protein
MSPKQAFEHLLALEIIRDVERTTHSNVTCYADKHFRPVCHCPYSLTYERERERELWEGGSN